MSFERASFSPQSPPEWQVSTNKNTAFASNPLSRASSSFPDSRVFSGCLESNSQVAK